MKKVRLFFLFVLVTLFVVLDFTACDWFYSSEEGTWYKVQKPINSEYYNCYIMYSPDDCFYTTGGNPVAADSEVSYSENNITYDENYIIIPSGLSVLIAKADESKFAYKVFKDQTFKVEDENNVEHDYTGGKEAVDKFYVLFKNETTFEKKEKLSDIFLDGEKLSEVDTLTENQLNWYLVAKTFLQF